MKKNKQLITIIAIGFAFIFIGTILIQSTENLYEKQNNKMSTTLEDLLQSEIWENRNLNDSKQTTSDSKNNVDDSTDSAIDTFINKTIDHYPILIKMGEKMGLTKQTVSNTIKNIGDDTTIKTYISFFSKALGI